MTEPWTPGPWEVRDDYEVWWLQERIGPPDDTVAYTSNHATEADARLIAAAPEMAELLVRCITEPEADLGNEATAILRRVRGEAEVPA